MPAYQPDGNDSIYNSAPHIINLDPGRLGLVSDKHISLDGSDIQSAARPDTTNASFDDTSSSTASSSSRSDLSDASLPRPMNGNSIRTRQTSMTSITNGQAVQPGFSADHSKPLANGTATLADRTMPSTAHHQQPRAMHPNHENRASMRTDEDDTELETTPTLAQRHTLEVPRKQPRGSRDGADAAFASGRFSPTMSTGPGPAASVRRASLSLARRATRSIQSDLPRDEIAPDEDALHWAEVYRQRRASKKRRREEEDDDKVLVGTKVDEHHVNWVTAYNMLTGIRVSVSRTNAKLDRELTDADFQAKQKSTFDILDPADYLMSLTGKYILSELGSPGKSGSFFYFSRDYKYIIKTIHHAEHKFLRKILKDYYQHVRENPNTLLSQFYGLHRVKMPYGKKIHFVVMNNLFPLTATSTKPTI
ncbi:unnamed protein product [Parascedosporium putredinis]|uniref:PIPK domain-containing protein n=1 Tax=Parascedosporium putredinis TaxID=1442378 RepID=A0A9P1MDZ1_9PEZI|nr:unnamed protein product [Parascedosporium putredinis]CAI8000644.1 unnamed protein product [Parascedosporium putredinis]